MTESLEALSKDAKQAIGWLRRYGTDDARCEAKSCSGRLSSDVWESVSAFANTFGGLILLGLDERRGFALAERFDSDKVRDQFIEGMGDGGVSGSRLGNPPRYVMDRVEVDGGQVLAIRIIENEIGFKPCYILAKGVEAGSYKRVDDKDLRLTHMEIYEYRNALIPSRADSTPVPESGVDDLDGELTDALIGRKLTSKALAGVTDRATRLERLNVLASDGRVRLAGLLALGQYPQQFEPKLLIDVACHPGTGKSMPGMPRFLDRVLCDGPLPTAIEDAVHATVRNLRTISVVNGVGRRDECELPVEALREAIANAVVHREYHPYFTGQSVSVDVFSDCVVVRNPGGLWGGKTLENIADGTSCCRNAILMQLMESVPAPVAGPTIEGQGSGVELMIRLMRERGLPEPEFRASADQFAVVFHRPAKADWRLTSRVGQDDLAGDDPIVSASSVSIGRKPGIGREVAFLSIMTRQGACSARELAEQTGVSVETARRTLRSLVKQGKVVPTDTTNSRNRRYRLP